MSRVTPRAARLAAWIAIPAALVASGVVVASVRLTVEEYEPDGGLNVTGATTLAAGFALHCPAQSPLAIPSKCQQHLQ